MNEAALLLYATTAVASASLGWNSFKHRFLPVARPLAILAYILAMFSGLRFFELFDFEMSQWTSQALTDLNFLNALFLPLWVWLLIEYWQEKKIRITDKRVLIFFIQPLVLLVVVFSDIFSNGFLSQESATAIIDRAQRLGAYAPFRVSYGLIIFTFLIALTPYLMIKKQQTSFWTIVQVIAYPALPLILFALYRFEFISISLTAPSFVIYLYWVSRQYRLLDAMPVALKSIMDEVDSGILVNDLRSKLLYVNDYANNFLGLRLSAKDLQQRKIRTPTIFEQHFDFTSPKKQVAQLEIKTSQQARVEDKNTSKKGSTKKKEKRYFDAILQPIFSPKSNKHLGSTVALHDVTERKQAEMELQDFDRQKSEFFAGISHEFRTPLTLSLGNIDDLLDNIEKSRDHIDTDELKDALSSVKNNNKRLLNLVNQLLELSRLNAGSLQIHPKLLHLDSSLSRLIANFESLADKQNIRLHLQIDQQTAQNPQLYFDVDAFEKIIINLVSNALKSMPEGGDVYIQLNSIDDQYCQLSVRDTGCGIPANAVSKVFEMFYSHQSNNTAWPQGVGVGLSLVKQLLKQHGADIEVSSVIDEGTIFTVKFRKGFSHFPDGIDYQVNTSRNASINTESTAYFADETEYTDTDSSNGLSESELKIEREKARSEAEELVLLVEDNAEMRAYVHKHLITHFRVITAADGEEGLSLALETMPDLVLSDVMMPKMNGFELCKQLKTNSQTSHIPILLLTAKSSQSDKLEGLELGADDYLGKPFDVKELTIRLKNLITSRRIIKHFYQTNGLQKVIDNPVLPKREKAFLDTLQNYVRDNISKTDIKVGDLAKTVFMSESSLNRKLKGLTGGTPKKMLLTIRLEYATDLLRSTSDSISIVSGDAGFSDSSHFTRSFRAHFSMTPTAYRKQAQSTDRKEAVP